MPFELLPCTLDDMPAVSRVLIEAHRSDPIVSRLIPLEKVSAEVELKFWIACHNAEFHKPGRLFFKLVDTDTSETVGMLNMHKPYTLSSSSSDTSGAYGDDIPLPAGSNEALAAAFFGQMAVHEARNLDHRTMYFVNVISVLPAYQKRGLGALILRRIMDMADEDGARIYLEATGAGRPVYERLGWVEFEFFDIDVAPYGGEGLARMTCMYREPKMAGEKAVA